MMMVLSARAFVSVGTHVSWPSTVASICGVDIIAKFPASSSFVCE